jgi:hypothetical protein
MASERRKKRIAYVESRLKEKGIKSNRPGKRGAGERRARAQFRSEFRAMAAGQRGRATSASPSRRGPGSKEQAAALYAGKQRTRQTTPRPPKKTTGFPYRGRVRDAGPYRPGQTGRGGRGSNRRYE